MLYDRIFNLPRSRSFFLFGARGTGKSTLLTQLLPEAKRYDLLDFQQETEFSRRPMLLYDELHTLDPEQWVIIDEIQKVPELLDVVHKLIFEKKLKFALTGSSARKLKRGQANLLAGRAFLRHLFPLTHSELGTDFILNDYLRWGGLPEIFALDHEDRREYLNAYVKTYLREEIASEQLVRRLVPFHRFLEVSGQCNGKIVNYSKIARDIDSDPTTVKNYFQILEETMVGLLLPGFHKSIRKRQRQAPKFYFFDLGIARCLRQELSLEIKPGTYLYGDAFEHFIVLEVHRLNLYLNKDWQLSYLHTQDGSEVDLIIERPGLADLFVEIKSKDRIDPEDLTHLARFKASDPQIQVECWSNWKSDATIRGVQCRYWQEALTRLFSLSRLLK